MKSKSISFKMDSLEWTGGVSDTFSETPLGKLSKPLSIEDIAVVEWTIVDDNYITVLPIVQDTQIKYWLKIPEKFRDKIVSYTKDIFPFEKKDISDRFLLAYSVESSSKKYIGFTFESVLKASKASLYVFTQAEIKSDLSSKVFLEKYLDTILSFDPETQYEEDLVEEDVSIIKKIFNIFRF
jgi:hypothetical protein